jgi:hypothetical protein
MGASGALLASPALAAAAATGAASRPGPGYAPGRGPGMPTEGPDTPKICLRIYDPQALALAHPPVADCARYDRLRGSRAAA